MTKSANRNTDRSRLFNKMRGLIVVTGPRGAGKTRLLLKLIEAARQAHWTVCGLLSPARVENSEKFGFDVIDVRSGTRRPLASRISGQLNGPQLGHWTFDGQALTWGNALLAQTPPCGLFVLDELGPLEFNRGQGWTAGLDFLAKPGACRLAVVVVRPEYVETFERRCPGAEIVTVNEPAAIDGLAKRLAERYWKQP